MLRFFQTTGDGLPLLSRGVEQAIIDYVSKYGEITSLNNWAETWGIDPKWARTCARSAANKKLIQLIRLEDKPGQPYKVVPAGGEA